MATKAPIKLHLRTVHPEYATVADKMNELHARADELVRLIRPLREEAARHQISWIAQTPKARAKPVERHPGAVALLGDLLPPPTPEELDPPPPPPTWYGEEELRALGTESEEVQEAIKLLGPVWAKARAEGSKKVCEQRLPEYRELVGRVVKAVAALGDVLIEHHEFVDEIRVQGASWSFLRPLNLHPFGELDEPASILRSIVRDAIEAGHVPASVEPKWTMPADLAHLETR